MDSLKSLLDKKQYELILKLTEESSDFEGLTYRVSALMCLGRYKDALDVIEINREVFELSPLILMKVHFEILINLKAFDKAYIEMKHYQDMPYVSQEVEEYLRVLPDLLRKAEKTSEEMAFINPDTIKDKLLTSKDDYEILSLINYIRKVNGREYYPYIVALLKKEDLNPNTITYALLYLVGEKYHQVVTLSKNGKKYSVMPSDLEPPFLGNKYYEFALRIGRIAKDPSVASCALNILNDYIIELYPDIALQGDENVLLCALIILGRKYLASKIGNDDLYSTLKVLPEEVEKKRLEIELLVSLNKPIVI